MSKKTEKKEKSVVMTVCFSPEDIERLSKERKILGPSCSFEEIIYLLVDFALDVSDEIQETAVDGLHEVKAENAKLKNDLKIKEDEILDFKHDVNIYMNRIEELDGEILESRTEYAKLQKAFATLEKDSIAIEDERDLLRKDVKSFMEEIESLKEDVEYYKGQAGE